MCKTEDIDNIGRLRLNWIYEIVFQSVQFSLPKYYCNILKSYYGFIAKYSWIYMHTLYNVA